MSAILRTAATGVLRRHWVFTNRGRWESGLLVEPARTNLVRESGTLNLSPWSNNNVSVTSNAVTAPDGTLTGDKVVEVANNNFHFISQLYGAAMTTGTSQALSGFARAGERSWAYLMLDDAGGVNFVRAWFNLATGTVGTVQSGGTGSGAAAWMTRADNGWWRCFLTGIPHTSGTTARVICGVANADAAFVYNGDGTSGVHWWGVQAEDNTPLPSSLIPTTTTTAARNADSLTRTLVGTAADRPRVLTAYLRAVATATGEGYPLTIGGGVDTLGLGRGIGTGGAAGAYTTRDGGSTTTAFSFPLAGIVVGDVYEIAATYTPTLLTVRGARNHGVEVSGTSAVSLAFDATWPAAGVLSVLASIRDVVTHSTVLAGTRTLAECRAATGAA